MRKIKYTTQFKRDYKRQKRGKHKSSLDLDILEVVKLLIADTQLPARICDHSLKVS